MIKALAVFVIVGVAVATPIIQQQYEDHNQDHHYHEPNYEFGYSVHDGHTGDVKNQHEVRHGDNVEGQYSLLEPDGNTRTVHYQADKHNGFNAVVQREGHHHHQQAPIAHAAPIAHHNGVPLVRQTIPFAHTSHVAAPLFNSNYHQSSGFHQPLDYSQGHAQSSIFQTHSNQHNLYH